VTEETVTVETFMKHATPDPVKRGWVDFVNSLEIMQPTRVPDHLRFAPVNDVRSMLRATAYASGRKWTLRFAEIDGDLFVMRTK
jgi:hypothetical protein